MAEEKVVVQSYIVNRNEDGSVDVADNSAAYEGSKPLSDTEIHNDITEIAKLVETKRMENAAFVAAYNGVARFFAEVNAQNAPAATPVEE